MNIQEQINFRSTFVTDFDIRVSDLYDFMSNDHEATFDMWCQECGNSEAMERTSDELLDWLHTEEGQGALESRVREIGLPMPKKENYTSSMAHGAYVQLVKDELYDCDVEIFDHLFLLFLKEEGLEEVEDYDFECAREYIIGDGYSQTCFMDLIEAYEKFIKMTVEE